MKSGKRLVVLDANALLHRAYHALPPLTSPQGEPVGALYGLCLTLFNVLKTFKPTHVAAAFDRQEPTFRHQAFAAYKARRKKTDDELIAQIIRARGVFAAFGIPVLDAKGFEADDIIGTLAARAEREHLDNVIVTGDQDTLQLVDRHTRVHMLRRGVKDTVTLGVDEVQERYGLTPSQMVDFKALRGDPSDNIPGVRGIGEKTATALLQRHETLAGLYAHLADLPAAVASKLRTGKQDAFRAQKLVVIRRTVPLASPLADLAWSGYERQRAIVLLQELGFSSLLPRLPDGVRGSAARSSRQGSLIAPTEDDRAKRRTAGYHLVESVAVATKVCRLLEKSRGFVVDTETDALGARTSPLHGVSLSVKEGEAWYVPATLVKHLQSVLEDPRIPKWGHNLKYDVEALAQVGIRVSPVVFDTMLASYILAPGTRSHSLNTLAFTVLGHEMIPIEALIGGAGRAQQTMSEAPRADVAEYSCEDADYTLRLVHHFQRELQKQPALLKVFTDIEVPLVPVLAHMELAGVKLNVNHLQELGASVGKTLRSLETSIYKLAGGPFNINSPLQLRDVLFTKLRLSTTGISRTQSGLSTAADELDKLEGVHPVIPRIREYRELMKLQGTYLAALPQLVDRRTGRIYTNYNQSVAATGRLSSSDPNFQNIPIRTELGNEIRKAFVAERGQVLLAVDYSQLELRIAAHIARDRVMQNAFKNGRDIHRETAAFAYDVPPEKVTEEQRRQAKTLNFGVLYGMGPQAFSRAAGVSLSTAQAFIDEYMRTYRGIAAYIEEAKVLAATQGYVETIYGRRRYLPDIQSRNPQVRSAAERMAVNHPIQGTASDIIKRAMIAVYERLERGDPVLRGASMILQVHDELVFEAPAQQAARLARFAKELLESMERLSVPLVVDVRAGKNWGELRPVT